MNRVWKTVLAATAFNLLFEYSMRGANNLIIQPLLPFILFTVYFSLYTMLEDLIVRYRLKDYNLMIAAFFFGTAYQFLVSGSALLQPGALGVNWANLFFVIIVWWGTLQSVATFYVANRIAPRDWRYKLSKKQWITALAINFSMVLLFQLSGAIPRPSVQHVILMLFIMAVAAMLFKATLPKTSWSSPQTFQHSVLMDLLSALTAGIFFFCAIFLTFDPVKAKTSNVNATATLIVIGWTTILALIMLVYRVYTKKSISV